MPKDFQDQMNEDGAIEPAKTGPVPPVHKPPTPQPKKPDFQDEMDEDGVVSYKVLAPSTLIAGKVHMKDEIVTIDDKAEAATLVKNNVIAPVKTK